MVDKTMIGLTISLIGVILMVLRNKILVLTLDAFLKAFKEIDIAILSMVVITLSVHFLSVAIDHERKLNLLDVYGTGLVIVSIAIYIFVSHRQGEKTTE